MSWPFQGRKTNDHALIKGCGKLDASASPQLPAPFLRFFTPAHRDSRAVLPAAGHGGQRTPNIIQSDTLPALRFAGTPGITTSRDRGSSPIPLRPGIVPVRRRRAALPDPSRRDYRTHAAYAAAEFNGRVNSNPLGQGMVTPRCIVLTRLQLQKWRQPCARQCSSFAGYRSRNGFEEYRLQEKCLSH